MDDFLWVETIFRCNWWKFFFIKSGFHNFDCFLTDVETDIFCDFAFSNIFFVFFFFWKWWWDLVADFCEIIVLIISVNWWVCIDVWGEGFERQLLISFLIMRFKMRFRNESIVQIEDKLEIEKWIIEYKVGFWGILDENRIVYHGHIFNHYIFEKVQIIINHPST